MILTRALTGDGTGSLWGYRTTPQPAETPSQGYSFLTTIKEPKHRVRTMKKEPDKLGDLAPDEDKECPTPRASSVPSCAEGRRCPGASRGRSPGALGDSEKGAGVF